MHQIQRRVRHTRNHLSLPESVKNNNQFEKQNPDIPINVYGYEYEKIFPLRITQERDCQHHVNLFQVTDQTKNAHFELVKNKFFAKDAVF